MSSLFTSLESPQAPLAERLRPQKLAEVVGQEALLAEDAPLPRMLKGGHLPSLILWGPPGCGKTTIARLLARAIDCHMEQVSAVTSGVVELKKLFQAAETRRADGVRTLLFVDEIHRFNRAQQDAFLPFVEKGTILLVGATTENPSFELNAALLSRCKVLVLQRLDEAAFTVLRQRAEKEEGKSLNLTPEGWQALCAMADGDGRYFLNLCEELFALEESQPITPEKLAQLVQRRAAQYDKAQEAHYNLISALHKSLRGSDVDAALYWFLRMLEGGEDPLYIARRLVRFAAEDIGMADPRALQQAMAAKDAYHFIGSPEGELALAQCVVYLATAPKSNAVYTAFNTAKADAKAHGSLMPPKHILNAPTTLMKELGYSKGYAYDHNAEDAFSGQDYFPEEMERRQYYRPSPRGYEPELARRLAHWAALRRKRQEEEV